MIEILPTQEKIESSFGFLMELSEHLNHFLLFFLLRIIHTFSVKGKGRVKLETGVVEGSGSKSQSTNSWDHCTVRVIL